MNWPDSIALGLSFAIVVSVGLVMLGLVVLFAASRNRSASVGRAPQRWAQVTPPPVPVSSLRVRDWPLEDQLRLLDTSLWVALGRAPMPRSRQ